jgi:TolB-like protein
LRNARPSLDFTDWVAGVQFCFADHVLDVARRELRRNGEPVNLEPQVFDLLVHLIRNRDRVVTKDDLLTSVWGGRIVSESTMTSRVNSARKAVGDSGDAQRFIRTVPRKGFRFVGEVTDGPTHELPAPEVAQNRASIAVLAFNNLTGDQQDEYFVDGIVEEIITGLSRIKWLLVISRNSTFIYKGNPADIRIIGRELGVRYVLEGSVRRSGSRVRVTGQLTETETGTHIWADRYDRTLGDIFALQDEMTMSVIGAVEPTLRRAEVERIRRKRPGSLDAYDLFLRALPLAGTAMPADADGALAYLHEAIKLEPDYAAAHGFIAWCHEQRYLRAGLHPDTREAGLRHARLAIHHASDDALALAMGGFVIGVLERNYETALEALDRSLALSPSSALAFGFSSIIRAWIGEDTTAIEHARMGIRLSPYDPLIYLPYVGLAYAYFFMGRFTEAASAASRAASASPRFSVPRYLHAAALVRLGRMDEARTEASVVLDVQPGFTVDGLASGKITTPERMKMLTDALRKAGLPS